jgi:hypothetical protein
MTAAQDSEQPCRVCRADTVRDLLRIDGRRYLRCEGCEASFVASPDLPSAAAELAQYRLHRNDIGDPGYRRFLARLAEPLLARLAPGARGIDYGCGPGPALAAMLTEAGHEVVLYDPFFHRDDAALRKRYDFVTATESIEHFHRPADEFDRFDTLLRPGAWLGLMTAFQTDDSRFAGWHYRRDPTHVVFYRESTLRHLAEQRGWSCEIPARDVALMRKL